MVTTDLKPMIDTPKNKEKESQHSTIETHQSQREQEKKGMEKSYKTSTKQITKWQLIHINNYPILCTFTQKNNNYFRCK